MHEKEPGVYHLAIPVMDYFRDLDILLAAIERGINEEGITDIAEDYCPLHVEFTAYADCLQKVKTIRDPIRRKLSGEAIPEFKKKPEPNILFPVEF